MLAARVLVAVSARSMAALDDVVTLPQFRVLVMVAVEDRSTWVRSPEDQSHSRGSPTGCAAPTWPPGAQPVTNLETARPKASRSPRPSVSAACTRTSSMRS